MNKNKIFDKESVKYGLPSDVKFCKKCVLSNQKPIPAPEFKFHKSTTKDTNDFDKNGICYACRFTEIKDNVINWEDREKELIELCNKHRSKNNEYDCIVPGSGGKDSCFASHILKHKYNMNPLTITWAPHIYTEIGFKNFQSWIHSGFDNILMTPNGKVHKKLTRLAFENLLHPFQPFVFGQRFAALRVAQKYKIPLIFVGENPYEYGANSLEEAFKKGFDKSHFCMEKDYEKILISGVKVSDLIKKHEINLSDLNMYMPLTPKEMDNFPLEHHFLGYYLKWDPQENYYYAVKNCDFEANTERTEGTYSKYAGLDDEIEGFHFFCSYIKFGIGRASMDAAQEIRCKKITREEAVSLVKKYDGEFPKKYFKSVLSYMEINEDTFWEIIDKARSPHLWTKSQNEWKLKHTVF